MKLMHVSDLHLGKRVNEYSMLEDQSYILEQILRRAEEEEPDAVVIAGDVYDKAVPSAEAVQLFDEFLVRLTSTGRKIFVISGNHDSPERIAFASRIMKQEGVYLSPVYDGTITSVTLTDEYGEVVFYLLPFLKPAHIRRFYEKEKVESYTDALGVALEKAAIDRTKRTVLITHQFVTGALRSESEEISVGGSDHVDVSVFDGIDYVALGHLHSPQHCGRETVRYCGSPLKYSFSEARDKKSITMAELKEKGVVSIRTIPLSPMRDMVELRGNYDTLMSRSFYEKTTWQEDYTHITLTDEEDIPDGMQKLRTVYHNLMKLDYDNKRTSSSLEFTEGAQVERKTPLQLFSDFYEAQNNQTMSRQQQEYMEKLIEKIWEE